MNLIEESITEWWGERCPEVAEVCPCCDAWAEYDKLVALTHPAPAHEEGSGEAVANEWHRADNAGSVLLYTLMQQGWRKGEPIMVNDVMVRIENANGSQTPIEPIARAILEALSHTSGEVTEDDVAARMWKAEAEDCGAPASVAENRTRAAFDDQAEDLKDRWRKFARAAIAALRGDAS